MNHSPTAPAVTTPAAPPSPTTHRRALDVLDLLERFGLLILLGVVIAGFSILEPDTFATASNFRSIVTTLSVGAVAALALVFPLVGGRFDVSVGANIGLCTIAGAAVMSKSGLPLVPAILVAIACGAAVGLFNGVIVAYFGISSIIGTLGTSTVLAGLITAYTKGTPISTGLSPTLTDLGIKTTLGIPQVFLITLLVSVAAWYVLTQTAYGRRLEALGVNLRAAKLTGMRTRQIVVLSFVSAGVLAGVAGILQIAAQGAADPQVGGITFILPAIAAAFLGATTWRPGRVNVPGPQIAQLFLGPTVSGLALVGAEPWVTDVFNGAAIIVAIGLSAQFRRRRTGELEIGD
jgi:ribose transport system permease protein